MRNVLIAVLDWGLGHATRCIPIIRALIEKRINVVIAGSGLSLDLLKAEFPDLTFITLPGYNVYYSQSTSMAWTIARQLPRLNRVTKYEHDQVQRVITDFKIDLVISDNRYGCWSKKVPCIIITHQLNIILPKRYKWLSKFVNNIIHGKLANFDRCWIPDFSGTESLSGILTDISRLSNSLHIDFIGTLSRFTKIQAAEGDEIVLLCSGPEPQRSLLEKTVFHFLETSNHNFTLVRGVSSNEKPLASKRGKVKNFVLSSSLSEILSRAKVVIARSGYSTVMDLQALQKKAIFIPTPAQTEQEYLALRLKEKNIAYFIDQRNFSLEEALEKSKNYSGFVLPPSPTSIFETALDKALQL